MAVAMLGTDRRDPPPPPDPIADLVDDTVRERPSERLLAQVAATVAIRRAGVLPAPPVAPLAGPPEDDRPVISGAAAERWYQIVSSWPVLEDDWTLMVVTSGRRLPADLVPDVLARHRSEPVRWARAAVASGPIAAWLVEQIPDLASRPGDIDSEALGQLPDLPIPAELQPLLRASGAIAGQALAGGIVEGRLVHAHRAVLVNLIARMRPDALAGVAQALREIDPQATGVALATSLAELAETRRQMLDELA